MGAHAALVNFQLTGDVLADYGSPFGLSAGDTILATGTFDDSILVAGSGTISFADSINNISISVGSSVFTDANVVMGGEAQLTLSAATFSGLDYTSTDNGGFVSIVSTFTGGGDTLAGSWDAGSFQMTPVPLPGAVWLLGSGLIGLAGFMRRRNK
jgi:hypothetical protein